MAISAENRLVDRMAFASLKGITPALAREILARTGTEKNFFAASERQLGTIMGFGNRLFSDNYRQQLLEKARREADFVTANNIRCLYFTDDDYPQRLTDIDDAPLMLYALGKTDLNNGLTIGIVGTRHASPYGLDFVGRMVASLKDKVAEEITVISGLAIGIDAAAHKAALKSGLPTAGVLAHGLNTIYPAQHRSLAAEIIRNEGILLTEYRSDAPIHKGNFIARNRIVAALCDALIVAESARKGGALITARLASGYNRDVFALPGRTSDRYSEGCNRLIANHTAALVQDADDIIEAMRWRVKAETPRQLTMFPELSPEEKTVIDCIRNKGEAHITQLTMALNAPVSKAMGLLIDMEFKGLIMAYPGGNYRLA